MKDEETLQEQSIWEHYKAIESENYYLKRQLINKNKEINKLKFEVQAWRSKYKVSIKDRKQRYRNNGKAGK